MSTSAAATTEPGQCPCGLTREEVRNFLAPVTALCTALGADGNPCNRRWADHPREGNENYCHITSHHITSFILLFLSASFPVTYTF